ncbi:hypothetical protein, partial [Microcoleus anatoxicus]|uniref:hypothetical protein n=1 Tax=Microcoleus anatoxicus TaxID=2705319 RepID=UPI0030C9732F
KEALSSPQRFGGCEGDQDLMDQARKHALGQYDRVVWGQEARSTSPQNGSIRFDQLILEFSCLFPH